MDIGTALAPRRATSTDAETSTRARVARAVGEDGPVTATALAASLGLTAAAVRRHLDAMLADGLIEARTPAAGPRRRGRPAKAFVLTDAGHASLTSAYDDLAVSALRYLAQRHGRDAVREFAAERVADLEERYAAPVRAAGDDAARRAEELARALSADGYAASTRPVGPRGPRQAVQLCQGHCPVQHVAAEFPELCEAEAAAFSRLLGVDVRRLATLANGEHVCTTHVPATPATSAPAAAQGSPRAASAPAGTVRAGNRPGPPAAAPGRWPRERAAPCRAAASEPTATTPPDRPHDRPETHERTHGTPRRPGGPRA
ncbi:helix-turn-helix transcriptional regulator [Thalassiella azotivora]